VGGWIVGRMGFELWFVELLVQERHYERQHGFGTVDGSRDNYYAFRKGDVPVYRRTQSVTAPEQSCKAGSTHRVGLPVEFSSNCIGT